MDFLKAIGKIFLIVMEIVFAVISLKVMIIKGFFSIANIIINSKHKSRA